MKTDILGNIQCINQILKRKWIMPLFLLIYQYTFAQPDTWSTIPNNGIEGLPSRRFATISFTINDKAYIGTGRDDTKRIEHPLQPNIENFNDFWEYNQTTHSWSQKADFIGTARSEATGFSIGDKGYVGFGRSGQVPFLYDDFYQYDPIADVWTQKASLLPAGGLPRTRAVGFAIGNKGYIGTGGFSVPVGSLFTLFIEWYKPFEYIISSAIGSSTAYLSDFWEFDPNSGPNGKWTRIRDFSGGKRDAAVGFTIFDKGYVFAGSDEYGAKNDVWEYDPAANSWTQKDNYPGGSTSIAAGFSICTKGYIQSGADFWEFDPKKISNQWLRRTSFPGQGNSVATGFSIGNVGYIGFGQTSQDFKTYPGGIEINWNVKIPSNEVFEYHPYPDIDTSVSTYYISSNGNDCGPGTKSKPWKTLDKVNDVMEYFKPGDSILFERGSWFFGTIEIKSSGNANNPIVFSAYGTGSKPVFICAKQENLTTDWVPEGRPNIWENRDETFYVDVANLVFSPGPTFGKKLMNTSSASLSKQGDFWYDYDNNRILIYSAGNPASFYSNIQCVLSHNAIEYPDNDQYIVFENLDFRYFGKCVVEQKGSNCSYKNLDISYIGGADLGGENDPYHQRYGHGLQMWNGVGDINITGCRLDNVYEAGIAIAGNNHEVINIKNNVITNCEYSLEFWNNSSSANIHDIKIEQNTCVNAGGGWSHLQRYPEISNQGTHFIFGHMSGTTYSNISIQNNIFYHSTDRLFWILYPDEIVNKPYFTINNNCFFKSALNEPVGTFNPSNFENINSLQSWQLKTKKEANSIYTDPLFVSSTDFHLQNGSALIGKGTNGYMGAFWPYDFYIGDITLSTQAQVDTFNYTGITGRLTIEGSDITNLTPLANLIYVGGDFIFWQAVSLTKLDGLQNLTSTGGNVRMFSNNSLINLDGLKNLTSIGGSLDLSYNQSLSNLDGLKNLTSVKGYVLIYWNNSLTKLDGLKNLTSIGDDLAIEYNSSLNNIDGLKELTSIAGGVRIKNNDSLDNLDGLGKLTSVGFFTWGFGEDNHGYPILKNVSVLIESNSSLTSFCGLYTLLSGGELPWELVITANAVDPITKQQIIDGGPCTTVYNGDLTLFTQAEVNEFHFTEITGSLTIGGNETYSSNITNLTPLSCLTNVGGSLNIKKNDFLTNLDGFENLTSLGGGINIWNDIVLTNVDGLRNLNSFNGGLSIAGNVALNNIDGFKKITSVAGGLQISANQSLADVDGLKNLVSVGAWLDISYNATITSLEGLNNLTSIGGDLEVHHNSALTHFCGLYTLLKGDGFNGNYEVYENKVNPTLNQILVACSSSVKPKTTIESPMSTKCDTWDVPVKVSGFTLVGAISLKLNYNIEELIYAGVDINNALTGASTNGLTAGKFTLEYFGNPVTLTDNETLFTLHFKVTPDINGTPFNLTWNPVLRDCFYAGPGGDPVYTTIDDFNNLSVNVITDKLPEIVCPGNIVVENDKGICGAVVTYLPPVGIDNCPNPETKQTEGLASGKVFPVGLTTNTFVVTDSQGNTAKCSFTVTVLDKQPPLVTGTLSTITVEGCGAGSAPAAVTSVAGLEALAGGIKINDACTAKSAMVVTSSDVSTGTCPIVVTRTYKVMDASSNSTNIIQVIKVADNTPPVITGTLSSTIIEGCGAESIPPAVTSVAALEALAGGIKINDACTVKSSLKVTSKDSYFGSNPLVVTRTYTIKDACNNSVTTTQIIKVADTTPPVITQISANPATLWPANNKMVAVVINYLATDNCSLAHVALSVTSNEPQSGKSADWIVLDNSHLLLRADRLGKGSGRIYTITITATDASGNSSKQKVTVNVPHNQSRMVLKHADNTTSESVNGLSAEVFPNPSNQYFTLVIQSNNQQPVKLNITDLAGKLIEMKTNVEAISTLQLGKEYKPGTYLVEVIQGKEKITLKMIKQAK